MSEAKPFNVIAIHGKAGSGKNYTADALKDMIEKRSPQSIQMLLPGLSVEDIAKLCWSIQGCGGVEIVSFASTLKEYLFAQNLCSISDLTVAKKSKELRQLFIDTGDQLRKQYGTEYFCKTLLAKMMISAHNNKTETFIICDLREEHEEKFLRDMYASTFAHSVHFIHMHAPNRVARSIQLQTQGDPLAIQRQASHSSEVGLDAKTKDRETAMANGYIFIDNDIE